MEFGFYWVQSIIPVHVRRYNQRLQLLMMTHCRAMTSSDGRSLYQFPATPQRRN